MEPVEDYDDSGIATLKDFWVQKYKKESEKSWDRFYKRNGVRFFKDRHWIDREFPTVYHDDAPMTALEIGCGVGNLVFPLLERHPRLRIYACDFSREAVRLVQEQNHSRCTAFVCDIVREPVVPHVNAASVDVISCIFVLGAISEEAQQQAVCNIVQALRPGGILIFRDYASGDQAHVRFTQTSQPSKIAPGTFVRHDGTISYFFTYQRVASLMARAGLALQSLARVNSRVENRKMHLQMDRSYLQGIFRREGTSSG